MSPLNNPDSSGAQAFTTLMNRIGDISEATCDPDAEGDTRDYGAIAQAVLASITAHIVDADAAHRADYLHALGDLLCCVVDGGLPSPAATQWGA